jgi:polysaccharide biosynthesis protein PslH
MTHILFVSPTPPWPADNGGRIRSSALLRKLMRHHEITLWCVEQENGATDGDELATQVCSNSEMFPRQKGSMLRQLSGPVQEQWFSSTALEKRLNTLRAGEFDLVHLDELCLIRHLPTPLPIPLVQHHHKLDFELAHGLGGPGPRRDLELNRWRNMELESVSRTKHQVFCSEDDAQRFAARHHGIQTSVVPNGVDSEFFDRTGPPRYSQRLLVLGDLDYGPNRQGITKFLDSVWPGLRAARPDLQLFIVGRGDHSALSEPSSPGASPNGVEWIGHVSDVRPWLSESTALVVPLDVGGGSRLKILEAAAARCPVLTTHVGLEGLDFIPGEHVTGVEGIAGLHGAIQDCLDYPERAAGRAIYAKELVRDQYGWRGISEILSGSWQPAMDGFEG